VYPWGPDVMGAQGSVVRHRLRDGNLTAFLDVFTTRDLGRLFDYCCGVWYATAPPADLIERFATSGSQITQLMRLNNQSSLLTGPNDSSWAARGWYWRVHSESSATTYQSVYLLASRDPGAADRVIEPAAPSLISAVIRPWVWLIQDRRSGPPARRTDDGGLTATASRIITTATESPRRR
jgi:hypothetical protein